MADEEWVDTEAAARQLGLPSRLVYAMISAGSFRHCASRCEFAARTSTAAWIAAGSSRAISPTSTPTLAGDVQIARHR